MLLALRNIEKLEKSNTLVYIPNAITIVTADKGMLFRNLFIYLLIKLIFISSDEYFFGSFIERDQCFQLLHNMREVERRLIALHGSEAILEADKNLDFGYLNRTTIFNKEGKDGLLQAASSAVKFKAVVVGGPAEERSRSGTRESNSVDTAALLENHGDSILPISPTSPSAAGVDIIAPLTFESILSVRSNASSPMIISTTHEEILPTTLSTSNPSRVQTENSNSTERPSTEKAMPQRVASPSTLSAKHASLPPSIISPPIVNAVKIAPDTFSVDNGDGVDLSKLFYSCGIASLGEKSFNFCAMDVYKHFWLKAAGYRFVNDFFVLFKKHQECFIKELFFCTEIS